MTKDEILEKLDSVIKAAYKRRRKRYRGRFKLELGSAVYDLLYDDLDVTVYWENLKRVKEVRTFSGLDIEVNHAEPEVIKLWEEVEI